MTIMPSREEFDAITRLDFQVFVERVFAELNGAEPYLDNWHVSFQANQLEEVRAGKICRLAIALPPRNLKSIVASVAFPAWLLGHDPGAKIICASYGQQLADDLARDCRQVMRSDWYRALFPATRLKSDRQSVNFFETTAGGSRQSTSVGGVLTGFGADFIIVDDPTKPEEALSDVERAKANHWLSHTLVTRLNNKVTGKIVLVMQRLHEDDMIGFFMSLGGAKLVSFPAIAQEDEELEWQTPFGIRRHRRAEGEALHPDREPLVALELLKVAMGSRMFSAQYLQMPAPPGGSIVKPEWFQRYDPVNTPEFDSIIQSWDTASKGTQLSDYSVCTTWAKKGPQLFLLHVLRKRLEYPDLKRAVVEQARLWNAKKVLVEDASSGQALIQDLKNDNFYIVEAVKPKGDKIVRLNSVTAAIEAGQVFVPAQAPWLDEYLYELMMFPAGRYDDQVDSTSQALSNALIFRSPGAGWLEMIDEYLRRREMEDVPHIRYNCDDKGMTFLLYGGRKAEREADGSFLATPEEAKYMAPICYRVDEITRERI
jgi:predicted phage terminase large subunit-like protein